MSDVFNAQSVNGQLSLGSSFNRARFTQFLKENDGIRLRIEPIYVESASQRGFFEGCIVPFVTYFQENYNHKDSEDLRRVRDWLKLEFNGELTTINGKVHMVAKSTKGMLNKGFLERVMDWLVDQGYPVELLDPERYKRYRDEIKPHENVPENYIDYLVSIHLLN